MHRHRRQSAVAGRARRRPRVSRAAGHRSGLSRRDRGHLRGRARRPVVPTIDDELRCSRRGGRGSTRAGVRVAVSPAGDQRASATTSCDTCQRAAGARHRRGRVLAAGRRCRQTARVPAVHQAAVRPRRRRRVSDRARRASSRSSSTTSTTPSCRSILDGPEFTIDMLCDFTAGRSPIVPRERVVDPRRRHRSRPHRARPGADRRSARPCAAALPFAGADQHPVPHRRRRADRLRDQPALLRRHSADDRRRRRLSPRCSSTSRSGARCRRASASSRRTVDDLATRRRSFFRRAGRDLPAGCRRGGRRP